jgi:hypothetical protein
VLASAGELEVRVSSRNGKKDAVVAVMVGEPADFRQADTIPVEAHDLVEPLRMSCDA